MRTFADRGLKIILILVASIAVGYLLLAVVYCIPTERMERNLSDSANIFYQEGTYPELVTGHKDSRLDNWTDALMMLTAVYKDNDPAYIASLKNTRLIIEGKNPAESLASVYIEHDLSGSGKYEYGRYWHGYLVLLKPLLYLMDYASIRYLNMFLQFSLFAWIAVILARQDRAKYIACILMAWLFMNPLSTMLSMQFTVVTYIVFVQLLLFLLFEEKYAGSQFLLIEHFLIAGCVTSYLDLLTFPFVALGIPLLFWILLHSSGRIRQDILRASVYIGIWGFGYSMMWAGKWVLGSVITRRNLIGDAVNQAAVRTGSMAYDQEFSYGNLLKSLLGGDCPKTMN